ncbi:MAG: glycosyltransferase family 4 protein [Terriglobales bacterium]
MRNFPAVDSLLIDPSLTDVDLFPNLAQRSTLRVLAVLEGSMVSGPAKNLFEFCRVARTLSTGTAVDLTLVTFHRSLALDCSQDTQLIEAAQQAHVAVERIPERFVFDMQVVSRLRKLVKRFNPDLIQTHASKSHFLLRCSGVTKSRPWIAFHHGYTSTDFRSPIYNSLDRWSLQAPDRIVTVSLATKEQLLRHGVPRERITVVHNAVQGQLRQPIQSDASALRQKKIAVGVSPDEKLILCVGRLSQEKAQIDLVSAMVHLRKTRPDLAVRVMIVGDGPERERIQQAILSAGVGESIILTGHLKDVTPYYEAADVLAIPSLSEGSPNALLEAMAFGVPVVATEVGGIPEIVTNGKTALLVPARDPAAMAGALERLISDPAAAASVAAQARKKVETEYSPEWRAKTLISIYDDVYGRRQLG